MCYPKIQSDQFWLFPKRPCSPFGKTSCKKIYFLSGIARIELPSTPPPMWSTCSLFKFNNSFLCESVSLPNFLVFSNCLSPPPQATIADVW